MRCLGFEGMEVFWSNFNGLGRNGMGLERVIRDEALEVCNSTWKLIDGAFAGMGW